MSVNPVAAVSAAVVSPAAAPLSAADLAAPTPAFDVVAGGGVGEMRTGPTIASGGAFESMLSAVNQLNGELLAGDKAVRNLALGNGDSLHESMMALEHARLSLELMLQVRNGALEAYQDLMRMQV